MLDEEGNSACDDLVSSGQGSLDEAEDCCSTSATGSTDEGLATATPGVPESPLNRGSFARAEFSARWFLRVQRQRHRK